MNRVTESSTETNHFIFFEDYEEERFEEFVDVVIEALNIKEASREIGPYSELVVIFYEGHKLSLTSGSYEGCFVSMGADGVGVARKIIEIFRALG